MTTRQTPTSEMIAAMDGAEIPGGCEHCDAYQKVHAGFYGPNTFRLAVHHDDWCPFLASLRAGQ